MPNKNVFVKRKTRYSFMRKKRKTENIGNKHRAFLFYIFTKPAFRGDAWWFIVVIQFLNVSNQFVQKKNQTSKETKILKLSQGAPH